MESLQEILCKLAQKYCWETANCREGSFGFVSTGEEGRGLHCSFYRPIYIGGIGIKKCVADEGSEELGRNLDFWRKFV